MFVLYIFSCFTVSVSSFLYCLRVPVSALVPHQGTMLQDREICCDFRVFLYGVTRVVGRCSRGPVTSGFRTLLPAPRAGASRVGPALFRVGPALRTGAFSRRTGALF
jgi:hypothetical protein